MTAHLLHYSAVASNLTPKLTEAEIVEMISGHYPAYVQRRLLSAGVKTIHDVLNFLNRLESIETYGKGDSDPGAPARNRADSRNSSGNRGTPGFQNVRNMRYQGTRNNDRHRQRSDYRCANPSVSALNLPQLICDSRNIANVLATELCLRAVTGYIPPPFPWPCH
jgi:hypothetical protein